MRGCGNPGGAAIVGSASPSEGLAVKTRPGSYSVRVLECADVGVGGGGWGVGKGRGPEGGGEGGLRVGADRPDCSSIFVPLTP